MEINTNETGQRVPNSTFFPLLMEKNNKQYNSQKKNNKQYNSLKKNNKQYNSQKKNDILNINVCL